MHSNSSDRSDRIVRVGKRDGHSIILDATNIELSTHRRAVLFRAHLGDHIIIAEIGIQKGLQRSGAVRDLSRRGGRMRTPDVDSRLRALLSRKARARRALLT